MSRDNQDSSESPDQLSDEDLTGTDGQEEQELNIYEEDGIDDESVESISYGDKIAAEAALDERDRKKKESELFAKIPPGCCYSRANIDSFVDLTEVDNIYDRLGATSQRIEDIENTRGMSTEDWLSREDVKYEIIERFKLLLTTSSVNDEEKVIKERIIDMSRSNRESFELEYSIIEKEPALARFLDESPQKMINIFNFTASYIVWTYLPSYRMIAPRTYIRIKDPPRTLEIRELRQSHLNRLFRTQGVVSSASSSIPQLSKVCLECLSCSYIVGPFEVKQSLMDEVKTCPNCQLCGRFTLNEQKTTYRNYQRLTIQEFPSESSAGRVPRFKKVVALSELCNLVMPGDEIILTGIYCVSNEVDDVKGFPSYSAYILANNIVKQNLTSICDDDESVVKKIQDLSKDPKIVEKIIASICPPIYGHYDVKRAIALSIFGGCPKNRKNAHKIRGDINVLLCGDPGSAKSQFLKYLPHISPKAVYTTGQGVSGVGLTAYVERSPVTKEWTLEAGALVLADGGICMIDEFDKMSDIDRTSIHEAMEQQTISVSKAGIVAHLQARCAVIAASNPIGSRYNDNLTFAQNVMLTDAIISRFDLVCVVKDDYDKHKDSLLAKFVAREHMKSHPDLEALYLEDNHRDELINQDLLKEYIRYARNKVKPIIDSNLTDHIADVYAQLRIESMGTNSILITARHIDSFVRCSEAFAKMHLRNRVTRDDVRMAIEAILGSFISVQKREVKESMEKTFARYLNYKESTAMNLLKILQGMVRVKILSSSNHATNQDTEIELKVEDFQERCLRINVCDPSFFYSMPIFANNHFTLDDQKNLIYYSKSTRNRIN